MKENNIDILEKAKIAYQKHLKEVETSEFKQWLKETKTKIKIIKATQKVEI